MINTNKGLIQITVIFLFGSAMAEESGTVFEERMADAERWFSESRQEFERAARRVADLSIRRLPHQGRIHRAGRGPLLGVTVGGSQNNDHGEGVEILAITPGGAADEAGLRTGDYIISVNGQSLTADTGREATKKLLNFMADTKADDVLEVKFSRDGKIAEMTIALSEPRARRSFAFNDDDSDPHVFPRYQKRFHWFGQDDVFGEMEMVRLTERLGSYFGTAEGLLVVRSPDNEALKLQDGDVILKIDGRIPKSVSHAIRILGSYQVGEDLTLDIMRDKHEQQLEINMTNMSRNLKPLPISVLRQAE